ncbi:MAG: transcriptional regulator [Bdellovibrio sp.]|nr:MAG: transcriptional regulator [Bdellovibrio sp.]
MKQNKYFDDLKEGLTSAVEYEKGKLDLRTTKLEIPQPPPALSKKKIKILREEVLGVSQPLFARILGVSTAAVRAWEQGNKKPSGTARRLMQLFEEDPSIFQRLTGLYRVKAHN